MVTFHDPRGAVGTEIEPYELSHNVAAQQGDGVTVGLLANGFPDSENFLNALGTALTKRLPKIAIKSWNKGNASIAAPQDMLEEIRGHCQVAIAAYGH